MKSIVERVNSSYNLALIFFLFAGALYFIYYTLESSKFIYILVAIFIYTISFFIRTVLLKSKPTKGFTEPGIFFISFLLTAYILFVLDIDKEIANYLPNVVLLQSGVAFIFIFLISLASGLKNDIGKFVSVILLFTVIFIIQLNQDLINNLFLNNSKVADLIIGFPIIYLIITVFGLDMFFTKVKNNSHNRL